MWWKMDEIDIFWLSTKVKIVVVSNILDFGVIFFSF